MTIRTQPIRQGSLHTRYVGPEEQAMGKVSVLKDLNFCNRHEGTDRSVRRPRLLDVCGGDV